MTRARSLGRVVALAGAVLLVDQASKALVRSSVLRGERHEVLPFLDLVHVRNTGIAFGFLQDGGALLIAGTSVALVALMAFVLGHANRPLVWLPAGLLLGGAAGNLVDRVREGSVTDFLKLPAWPAFNAADIAITFGVLSLLYVLEGPPRRREAQAAGAPQPADGG
ncbi:MAG TPA: signal peptidase II [Solirubrobacteraceae bacterium]|nr:signal peptidase II [Solirubrobacteraceae bacterium]